MASSEKENIAVCPQGFLRSWGLGFNLRAELPGNEETGGGLGPCSTFSSAPSLGLSLAQLAERLLWKRPFSPGRRTDTRAGWACPLYSLALSVAVVLRIYTELNNALVSSDAAGSKPYPSGWSSLLG